MSPELAAILSRTSSALANADAILLRNAARTSAYKAHLANQSGAATAATVPRDGPEQIATSAEEKHGVCELSGTDIVVDLSTEAEGDERQGGVDGGGERAHGSEEEVLDLMASPVSLSGATGVHGNRFELDESPARGLEGSCGDAVRAGGGSRALYEQEEEEEDEALDLMASPVSAASPHASASSLGTPAAYAGTSEFSAVWSRQQTPLSASSGVRGGTGTTPRPSPGAPSPDGADYGQYSLAMQALEAVMGSPG